MELPVLTLTSDWLASYLSWPEDLEQMKEASWEQLVGGSAVTDLHVAWAH